MEKVKIIDVLARLSGDDAEVLQVHIDAEKSKALRKGRADAAFVHQVADLVRSVALPVCGAAFWLFCFYANNLGGV